MNVSTRSAVDAARMLGTALEAAEIPYAIGGALALAIAGVPRGTADVDVNVFVEPARIPDVVATLTTLGVNVDADSAVAHAREDGLLVGRWDGMRIDVFVPSIPFSREAERTRIEITDAQGWRGWFLSAEAIAVFKLLFFRGKDRVDLERLVAVRPDLDRDYVRRWIVDMMGEDDERTLRWDRIVDELAPSHGV